MDDSKKIIISPTYMMKLVGEVEKNIWEKFSSYKNVQYYIDKWHKSERDWNDYWENFPIINKKDGDIDLLNTLHSMDGETLLKIAIDMGVETPDFIPSIPMFRNEIKSSYETASQIFEKAFAQIEEHPDIAIGLANSALESIIKEILKDERISASINSNKTLYELAIDILKEFHLYPNSDMPVEIKTIGSSLLSVSQSIEKLRSDKTNFHGKTFEDYIIKDPLFTYFVFNSIVTIGLFLNSYYRKKFPKEEIENQNEADTDDLPF